MRKIIFAALLSFSMLLCACSAQNPSSTATASVPVASSNVKPSSTANTKLSPTTGKATTKQYAPIGVMIENEKSARPQSGLQAADIVYEGHMEGKITRFFCIFNDNTPTMVGPIRSARTYWVKIQQEYGSIFVHFGGPEGTTSANVYKLINSVKIPKRVDGMTAVNTTLNGEKIMWRDSSRSAPHNAYANLDVIKQYYENNEPSEHTFLFDDKKVYSGTNATDVTLNFQSDSKVIYKYDAENNVYKRFQGTTAFIDKATSKQVEVTNVIVQIVDEKLVDTEHLNITTEGSGKAIFFLGGKRIEGTWQKSTMQSRTIYKDQSGNEIVLHSGNTWIHLMPSSSYVSSSN